MSVIVLATMALMHTTFRVWSKAHWTQWKNSFQLTAPWSVVQSLCQTNDTGVSGTLPPCPAPFLGYFRILLYNETSEYRKIAFSLMHAKSEAKHNKHWMWKYMHLNNLLWLHIVRTWRRTLDLKLPLLLKGYGHMIHYNALWGKAISLLQ